MVADLSAERIQENLATGYCGHSIQVFSQLNSTNDELRHVAAVGAPEGHMVLADAQLAGRGSFGRNWDSPGGCDLYLSLLLRPSKAQQLPLLTLTVGLAIAECLSCYLDEPRVGIKWPNDVLVDGRKCAGILVESSGAGTAPVVVVGIGINVNRCEWPQDLAESATSLLQTTGQRLRRDAVVVGLLHALEPWVQRWRANEHSVIVSELEKRLLWRGATVRCGAVQGRLIKLAADGALILDTATGPQELRSGSLELV